MDIKEGNLIFSFSNEYTAIKFDDTGFYRNRFSKSPDSKGVDIIADSKDVIQIIEIKNCVGFERDNLWRTATNNRLKDKEELKHVNLHKDSLDIEVSKKLLDTIACLVGAWTKKEQSENANELTEYFKGITDINVCNFKKQIWVILFLEGDFSALVRTRSKKMIMNELQKSMKDKLQWLNCKVVVMDSETYNNKLFEVSKI